LNATSYSRSPPKKTMDAELIRINTNWCREASLM
jgi:hypothetical protein